jgi:hypothetical protein
MRQSRFFLAAIVSSALLVAPSVAGASPGRLAKPDFKAYASCADKKPFKAAHRCGYDAGRYFRAPFVFKSNIGKRGLKACFQAFGPPPVGGGHACAKLGPLAYKAYPFKITGVRQRFSVKVTWFTRQPGKGFQPAASSFRKVRP